MKISPLTVALIKVLSVADEIIPPLGLGYLAEAVRRAGHKPIVVDALKEHLDTAGLISRLKALKPDVVGALLYSKDISLVRSLFERIRHNLPSVHTCVGGPHPSAVAAETMSFFADTLDSCFVGEAETGFPEFLNQLSNGEITSPETVPGLAYLENGEVKITPRFLEQNLDTLQVAWDLISPSTYPRAPHGAYFRQFPIAPIITSRGCPFPCTFCAAECISGKKVRRRSIENVTDEILDLHRRYGVREIHIEDDNFTGKKEYVLGFCESLRKKVPGITWTCPNGVRIDTMDREMLDAMKESGLYFLSIGIESGSNRVLKLMKKSLTVETIEEKIRLIQKAGIAVSGFFMLGFPGETMEEMERTIRFALKLPLSRASFANFQPFPGCEEFEKLRRTGEISVDWESFAPTLQSTTYFHKGISRDELRNLRKKALLKFYGRPAVAMGMIKEIRSLDHARWILKRGWRWLTIST